MRWAQPIVHCPLLPKTLLFGNPLANSLIARKKETLGYNTEVNLSVLCRDAPKLARLLTLAPSPKYLSNLILPGERVMKYGVSTIDIVRKLVVSSP